ncbi:DUF2945 domain-containing protein [Mucilaginibacter sp.]|uniref:DUF2945 domain-containing protein n=1 Tax=Mucilaginibacter sp. TaxID=1882438 RepID=UPI003AFFEC4D
MKNQSNINMKKGDDVSWKFGKGQAEGKVKEVFTEPVEKKIKSVTVKRNASKEKPAVLVKQKNGNEALKSESELTKGKKK